MGRERLCDGWTQGARALFVMPTRVLLAFVGDG